MGVDFYPCDNDECRETYAGCAEHYRCNNCGSTYCPQCKDLVHYDKHGEIDYCEECNPYETHSSADGFIEFIFETYLKHFKRYKMWDEYVSTLKPLKENKPDTDESSSESESESEEEEKGDSKVGTKHEIEDESEENQNKAQKV